MEATSADLMARWREGDQQAAGEMFRRYAERLVALARRRMSTRLARHLDPEDVVQSAYRSFFSGARAGCYALRRDGDLWRLLAAITLHKLGRQVERHTASKRAVEREQPFGEENALLDLHGETPARGPTPDEEAALAETLERMLRGLGPLERRMIELRLQGCSLAEIAGDVHRSERTVRRLLERVKEKLKEEG
jgi:RNA polymerase sigma factor (sigma-70 family)